MIQFCARYKHPDATLATAGVKFIEADSKAELLEIARSHEADDRQLALITIQAFGSSNQVWNAMRAAKRNGDGWFDEMLELYYPDGGFPVK